MLACPAQPAPALTPPQPCRHRQPPSLLPLLPSLPFSCARPSSHAPPPLMRPLLSCAQHPASTRPQTRHDKGVVDRDAGNGVHPLGLELLCLLDEPRQVLQAAGGRERAWHRKQHHLRAAQRAPRRGAALLVTVYWTGPLAGQQCAGAEPAASRPASLRTAALSRPPFRLTFLPFVRFPMVSSCTCSTDSGHAGVESLRGQPGLNRASEQDPALFRILLVRQEPKTKWPAQASLLLIPRQLSAGGNERPPLCHGGPAGDAGSKHRLPPLQQVPLYTANSSGKK